MCVYTYRIFHPQTPDYTFFSSTHETFTSTDQLLGCNTSPKKFKKTEIISSIFYDDNSIKLENNYKQKTRKSTNPWRLSNILLNNQ